jgi:hypothetical protein
MFLNKAILTTFENLSQHDVLLLCLVCMFVVFLIPYVLLSIICSHSNCFPYKSIIFVLHRRIINIFYSVLFLGNYKKTSVFAMLTDFMESNIKQRVFMHLTYLKTLFNLPSIYHSKLPYFIICIKNFSFLLFDSY